MSASAAFSPFAFGIGGPTTTSFNSQTIPLLEPSMSPDPYAALGGGGITIVDGDSLLPDAGPSGTSAESLSFISRNPGGEIALYSVRKGDTLAEIAAMFKVSVETILWANDMSKKDTLAEGRVLVILPITGVKHLVAKGDTLSAIAKKYKGNLAEIEAYNTEVLARGLKPGQEVIIPDGVLLAPPVRAIARQSSPAISVAGGVAIFGYYSHPLPASRRTQGVHGYNGVDLASFCRCSGDPVLASAAGVVIISREGGWGGGYGNYVVVSHANGTQTLYAHLSRNDVRVGERVIQGQPLGAVGNTGRSTGPHLHFEIRGARNPF